MLDLLAASAGYGGYISIIKFLIFMVMFFGWLPLLTWIYQDAKAVETKGIFWTAIVLGAGAAGAIIWLFIPVFILAIMRQHII